MADPVQTFTPDPPTAFMRDSFVRDPTPAKSAAPTSFVRDAPPAKDNGGIIHKVVQFNRDYVDPGPAVAAPALNFLDSPIRGLAGDVYGAVAGKRGKPGDILPSQQGFYDARQKVMDKTEIPENKTGKAISGVINKPFEWLGQAVKAASNAVLGKDLTKKIGPAATVAGDVLGTGALKFLPRGIGALTLAGKTIKDAVQTGDMAKAMRMAATPMVEGSDTARATAKDFANNERTAQYMRQTFDDALKKHDPATRAVIWNTADQASVAAQRAHEAAMNNGGTTSPTTTFQTAKGSTYQLHEDGTTTRDKAARPDVGHEGQSGPQPRSEKTYFVTKGHADELGLFQTQGGPRKAVAETKDGQLGVKYLDGKDAGKFERRTVAKPETKPAAGLIPVETWKGGTKVHFGNDISQVNPSAAITAEEAAKQAGDAVLAKLPADVRFQLQHIQAYGEKIWDQAREVGMVEGPPLPFYMTRALVDVGEDGAASYVKAQEGKGGERGEGGLPLDAMGVNLRTTGTKARKYLTTEETEAAAKERFGPKAMILRDVRTLPMAIERMEKAVAGRKLINDIKEIGKTSGNETVSDVEKPGFFTVDHPAFKRYVPRFTKDAEGKTVPVKDTEGNIIFDRVPLYVSKEFEGPLRAVLRHKSGPIYQNLMSLKGKSMGLIMNSPLIHNMTEWGRALPMMPGKVVTGRIYFEGNKFRRDPDVMRQAVQNGLVPIGHRGYVQDITGMAEEPSMKPGRSLTAQILGKGGDLYSKATGDAIRRGVDAAGDFWHNTLLWDRVADLQAGIYKNARDTFMKKGLSEQTAGRVAAHLANRYAGALPHESMSEMARKVGNFALFSRSFTLGNIGVIKDVLTGLPKDIQAQIKRDMGELERKTGVSLAKRKALNAFMTDLALFYASNAITQNAFDVLSRDQSLSDVEKGYVDRMKRLLARTQEHPLDALNPFDDMQSLMPGGDNEPGKEDRILMNTDKDGTAQYARMPVGKVGEEFKGWVNSPLQEFTRKEGTSLRPLLETITNDQGFGRKVYDPKAPGYEIAGDLLWNFMKSQIPDLQIQAAGNLLSGTGTTMDKLKVVSPFLGFNVSKGYPGGPAEGVVADERRDEDTKIQATLPKVNDLIRAGKTAEATQLLQGLNLSPGLIKYYLKVGTTPSSRLSARRLQDFYRSATKDQIGQFERTKKASGQ